MSRARMVKGVGQGVDPLDGDRVVIELGVRDGRVAYIGAGGIVTGSMTWVGDTRTEVTFKSGAEARVLGRETFAGCETARRAALILYKVFIGRAIEEALRVGARDLIAVMESPPETDRCVVTVLEAVRNALIDVQVTNLAEAIVEARGLRAAG